MAYGIYGHLECPSISTFPCCIGVLWTTRYVHVLACRRVDVLVCGCNRVIYRVNVGDRIRRYRQSPVTHTYHEDTLTNVRSMRSAVNDGPS